MNPNRKQLGEIANKALGRSIAISRVQALEAGSKWIATGLDARTSVPVALRFTYSEGGWHVESRPIYEFPLGFAEGKSSIQAGTPDVIAERLESQAGGQIDEWIEAIEEALESATSLEDFRDYLDREAWDQLQGGKVLTQLGDAMEVAGLAGYLEAQEGQALL